MPNTLSLTDSLRLRDLGEATLVILNHLDDIDPDRLPTQTLNGFENSLQRIHQKIHSYQQRRRAAQLQPVG